MAFTRTADYIEIGRNVDTVVSDVSQQTRFQAVDSTQLTQRIQRLYSLALVDTTTGGVLRTHSPILDPAAGGVHRPGDRAEFFFRVPPKVLDMVEPFSTTIVPTQNGGKFIESHGSIIKQIRVSGTTGLRPNKRPLSPINLLQGFENLAAGFGRLQLPHGEATGWDDIMLLRNIFRLYSDIKEGRTDIAPARNVVMVWRNAKDLDFWIVEPSEFKLSAAARSPFTYEYSIALRTLSRYNYTLQNVPDPVLAMLGMRRFLSRIQGYTQALTRAFSLVSQQITRLSSFGVFGVNLVLGPALSVIRGLLAVKTSFDNFGPRVQYNAEHLFDNLQEAVAQLATVDPARLPPQDPLVNSLLGMLGIAANIMAERSLQDSVQSRSATRQAAMVTRYSRGGGPRGQIRAPVTGGSSTFIGNEPVASTVVEETVNRGESLRDIAQRCLGDRGRWHILAVLNDLRAPYVSATGGPGVLTTGDTVLCPTSTQGTSSAVIAPNPATDRDTGNRDENKLGEIQQAYGRDLRLLSAQQGSDVDLTDLVVGQGGDLGQIVGIPNVAQAMRLKFATERGELAAHPRYGSAYPLGSKATESAFTTFQIDVRNTIISDPRISLIDKLDFSVAADAMLVAASMRLIGSADILTTSFALRRF